LFVESTFVFWFPCHLFPASLRVRLGASALSGEKSRTAQMHVYYVTDGVKAKQWLSIFSC